MQFPLKLCFAMTINKSQGQTLREVGVYIREPCFSHGQLYVALSKAKKASSIKVLDEQSLEANHQTPVVRNVVSYTLLKRAGII
jgi:ATP-dependent DNA helicase PIF1